MLHNKTIAVVIPAYNEEIQISNVIKTIPHFVDRIIVVNDNSSDNTVDVVMRLINSSSKSKNIIQKSHMKIINNGYSRAEKVAKELTANEMKLYTPFEFGNKDLDRERVILINHKRKTGVGSAIATGYRWCRDRAIDCTAVMAGDGQMDPNELRSICEPVVLEGVDYVKGNRLTHRSAFFVVPKIRFFGNSILSLLTKIASGYWHVSDTQCGYTAISLSALKALRLHQIYKSYGCPNDILVKLNIAFCTVKEVGIKPVYSVGEVSKMKIWKVIPPISWLLFKSFFRRLFVKYLLRDFHPLFLLYNFSFILFLINIPVIFHLSNRLIVENRLPIQSLMVFTLLSISAFQSLFFAMWMDMQDNERLQK